MRIAPTRSLGVPILLLLLLAAVPTDGPAQEMDREAKIERAREAAPPRISQEATVVDTDGTVLREGTNGWTCLPEVVPGYGFPACNDDVWMGFLQAMQAGETPGTERIGLSYMLAGDAKVNNFDPADREQDEGEVWVQEGPHVMIAVPDPAMLEGLPTDPHQGGPYVMWSGTPYAHIMVPTTERPEY